MQIVNCDKISSFGTRPWKNNWKENGIFSWTKMDQRKRKRKLPLWASDLPPACIWVLLVVVGWLWCVWTCDRLIEFPHAVLICRMNIKAMSLNEWIKNTVIRWKWASIFVPNYKGKEACYTESTLKYIIHLSFIQVWWNAWDMVRWKWTILVQNR